MIFGLFKKSKTPLEEFKIHLNNYQKIMETQENEKGLLERTQINIDKITKTLIDDSKNKNPEVLNYFLFNKVYNYLIGYGINNTPFGTLDIILKSSINIFRELDSYNFYTNKSVIETIKTMVNYIDSLMRNDELKYSTKVLCMNFISEICKKFFAYPDILYSMKVTVHDITSGEDFLIFTTLLNIFATDHTFKEYENKKIIRRAIIICLSFEEISRSNYIENESSLCEVIIEKLGIHYQMIPNYLEIFDGFHTLEVGYNIKKTFPILSNAYLEFRDYIYFFSKVCNTIRSFKLIEKLKLIFFNDFLIKIIQEKIINHDLKISRTHIQYFVFIFKSIKNNEIIQILFNFIFGFNNSSTAFKFRKPEKVYDYGIKYRQDENDTRTSIENNDYNYNDHEYIRISLFLINNLNNPKENINKIIYVLFESFFEKCPFLIVNKLILPFAGLCIKNSENPNTQKLKKYPDLSYFNSLLSIYENGKFEHSLIFDSLENSLYKTYSHYINNDIDFFYHYQTFREENANNYNFSNEIIEFTDDIFHTPIKYEDYSKNIFDNHNDLIINMKTSISKIQNKMNYNHFSQNKQKIDLKSKIFDEIIEIEEEFNNIYIRFMKFIIEKLSNFKENDSDENLFLTNLILTIINIPCLEFDPILIFCQNILIDDDPSSNYSILNILKYLSQEYENKIIKNPNYILFLTYKKSEKKLIELDKKFKFPKNLLDSYKNESKNLENIIILLEFLKEFMSIVLHKFQFENLIEEMYNLYSNMLDSFANEHKS